MVSPPRWITYIGINTSSFIYLSSDQNNAKDQYSFIDTVIKYVFANHHQFDCNSVAENKVHFQINILQNVFKSLKENLKKFMTNSKLCHSIWPK